MSSTKQDQSTIYLKFAEKILTVINSALEKNMIEPHQAVAIMIECGKQKTIHDLQNRIQELSEKYTFLQDAVYLDKEETSLDFDNTIEAYIKYLINNNRSAEIPAIQKDISTMNKSMEELLDKYPEISTILNN